MFSLEVRRSSPNFQQINGIDSLWLYNWGLGQGLVQRRQEVFKPVGVEEQVHTVGTEDSINIVRFLKVCAKQKDLDKGSNLYAYIQEHKCLEQDCYVASALISMFAACGELAKAQHVLDKLPVSVRSVVTWNTMIAAYAQHGQGEEALKCFSDMQSEGHFPNAVTFTCALKACGSLGAGVKGKEIHDMIVNLGLLEKNVILGNALVDMYARCGLLVKAQLVFKKLLVRDLVAWTALITGYAQNGQDEEALKFFDSMQCEGHSPDAVAFTCALKACGSMGALIKGKEIHEKLVTLGLLEKYAMLGSVLVDMYVKCAALSKAQQVFDELSVRDVVAWTALIVGYAQQGQGTEALKCFDRMQQEGPSPNVVTFTCALKACGSIGTVAKGKQIHVEIVSLGMLEKSNVLGSTLVDMYARCGVLLRAQQVLDELPLRGVIAWTALMAGYMQQGKGEMALKCFDAMQCEGHSPDTVAFTYALKACGTIGAVAKGTQIHDLIGNLGILGENIVLGNALVDMYCKSGLLQKAQQMLHELPLHDVVTWNVVISGYVQQEQGEEALSCFDNLQYEGFFPDVVTFTCTLKACGSAAAIAKGLQIHDNVVSLGMLEKNVVLGGSLVDMYARCAALAEAQQVFDQLAVQDVVAWTALIAGYAQQGQGEEALACFERMHFKRVRPDLATSVCVLNAFNYSGLLDETETYISRMSTEYGITPDIEHYSCIIEVVGRAGKLDRALAVIERMPSTDYLSYWHALLGVCCKWGDVKIGRLAFERAVHLDNTDAAAYICMANIWTAAREDNGSGQSDI